MKHELIIHQLAPKQLPIPPFLPTSLQAFNPYLEIWLLFTRQTYFLYFLIETKTHGKRDLPQGESAIDLMDLTRPQGIKLSGSPVTSE